MRVVFRADASLRIGSGHVMRCLTLADALRERGCDCRFICRDHTGNLLELIGQRGHAANALPRMTDPGASDGEPSSEGLCHAGWLGADWETDAEQTRAALDGAHVDWLVVDHYALDARWQQRLRPVCDKLMVIDDIADRLHDCDLLLDQNLVADVAHRYNDLVPENCGLMLGPDYALLGPEYAELHPRVPPREGPVRGILVYFGGADSDNLTGKAIAAILSLERTDVAVDVVLNRASPHADAIRQQVKVHPHITLHASLDSLAPLMVKADLAVGAGGATSWERCCLGLPSVVITLAENQRPIAEELGRRGLILWLGHKNEVNETELTEALAAILRTGLPVAWSEDCSRTVDGRGAERVSAILMLDAQTPLRARLARLDDEAKMLAWANDPLVRQNAFNTAIIDPTSHCAWFHNRLRDLDNCRFYMVETGGGLPVGYVCFKRWDGVWKIDYVVDSRARDLDLYKLFLRTAMLAFRTSTNQALPFALEKQLKTDPSEVSEDAAFKSENHSDRSLSIAICSDAGSWINTAVTDLVLGWLANGHNVVWAHSADDLPGGDVCFYLSFSRIVEAANRARYRNNLVVHASDLPKGRGWSPTTWLILEGAKRIPVTLLEAVDEVDAGPIYLQEWIDLDGTELVDDWHSLLAAASVSLTRSFVDEYPNLLAKVREQSGEPSRYPRRRAKDSALAAHKTIAEQFDQLRVADNDRYPAFFVYRGKEYVLKITNR